MNKQTQQMFGEIRFFGNKLGKKQLDLMIERALKSFEQKVREQGYLPSFPPEIEKFQDKITRQKGYRFTLFAIYVGSQKSQLPYSNENNHSLQTKKLG